MMDKKTICFFIFAVGKANGGHYRSLITIAESLLVRYNVVIINVGYVHSAIIKDSYVESHFVFFNGFNFWKPLKEIVKIFNLIKVDYIHAFDYQSFFVARLVANKFKIPKILTKCGGPSPRYFYPYSKFLIVFSAENYLHFTKEKKFRHSKLYLIPNRVGKFQTNFDKVNELKQKYNLENKLVLLRICRICKFYSQSIQQSINLLNLLKSHNADIVLLVVGNIQDQNLYDDYIKQCHNNQNLIFITEPLFTANAKEIIDVANFVIGTGRGFMEASSKSKVMFSPVVNGDLPVLINSANFEVALEKNFSERVFFENTIISENKKLIVDMINSTNLLEIAEKESYQWFEKHFSLLQGVEKYDNVYKESYFDQDSIPELFMHWMYTMRSNVGTWVRNLKRLV